MNGTSGDLRLCSATDSADRPTVPCSARPEESEVTRVRTAEGRGSKEKVVLRVAQFNRGDLDGIWSLCRNSFAMYRQCPFQSFYELWHHKWALNPARTSDHVFGWVLEDCKDGIVGYIGIVPVCMKIGGNEVVGGTPHTWAVSRAYAAYGLSLYKQAVAWGDQRLLVFTTASEIPARLNTHLRFGLNKIPVKEFDSQLLWLIRPEVPVKWMLAKSTWRNWSALATRAPLAWVLKAVARVRFARHRRLRFPNATLPVESVKAFTDEFTQFWDEHKHQYGVTTVRDRAFLQWRHGEVPSFLNTAHHVFACRDNGRLRGYLVVLEQHQVDGSCPGHFRVADVFYDRSRPDVVSSLINYAFEFAKTRGCSLFEVSQVSQQVAEMLRSQRPYVRQSKAWAYWYKAPTKELADTCQREVWWPSGVDGDSSL